MSTATGRPNVVADVPQLFDKPPSGIDIRDVHAWHEAMARVEGAAAPASAATKHSVQAIVAAMREPSFYDDPPDAVAVRETHLSWVFLAGERAYKVKKPVVYPFVDYGTRARRRRYCHEEVRLNRRLAPSIYLGVRSIAQTDGGLRLSSAEDERAVEYAVEMRRFDERRTLAHAVEAGWVDESDIDALGRLLAAFHAAAPDRRRGLTEVSHVKQMLDENFETLLSCAPVLGAERVWKAERFASSYLAARAHIVGLRGGFGRVRDGHGDLRAEHVVLGERGMEIVDCVEFDPALREVDVGADLAFLVMDLEHLGAPQLGDRLVRAYRSAGGDPGPDDFISFHAAVRAWVRTKIACLRAGDTSLPDERRTQALEEARAFAELGERLSWRTRLPLALVVCGPPASGKSQLARAVSEASGLPVVDSDVVRKRLAGIEPSEQAPASAYDHDSTLRTYEALGREAAAEVTRGGGVIVEGTFGDPAARQAFRVGLQRCDVPTMYVECCAPRDVLLARAGRRDREGRGVSDAAEAVVDRMERSFDAPSEVAPGAHVALRTDRLTADVVEDLGAILDRRLGRSAGRAFAGS
jgi:aminoglycoside phosphotransferase family enzyme/predicted kinase